MLWLPMAALIVALVAALVWVATWSAPARHSRPSGIGLLSGRASDIAPGSFLVARRDLSDPNFSQSVVLMLRHDERSSMGLVINRRTGVALSEVFPGQEDSTRTPDPIFWGGPVGMTGVLALIRADRSEKAEQVFPGVLLITSKTVLEEKLAENRDASELRVYLGYCGWGPGQLKQELEMGAWHLMRGESKLVFDPSPESLWSRLIGRTELQIVRTTGGRALARAGL